MDPVRLLDLPLGENDAGAATVREYLKALLRELWREEDRFSGKRPFGNSGWSHDIYLPMIKAGIVTGELDENGYIESMDYEAADALVLAAIEAL